MWSYWFLLYLTSLNPLNLLCFRKPTQNNNSILLPTHNRFTIASQLLPNLFTILKGTRWLYFRSQFTTQARFYIRLTIDSQSPHNCFPIFSRFSRVPGGFILGTNSQPKLDSTSDSQSTHNRLTIIWSMFGSHVYRQTVPWEIIVFANGNSMFWISFSLQISTVQLFSSFFIDFERQNNDVHRFLQKHVETP